MSAAGAPLVGILGGYGRVGGVAARVLSAECGYRLRVGGRSADAAWSLARRLGTGAEAAVVDAADRQSLRHFTRGCTAVLDCSGTAFALRGRVRRSVLAAGVHYVGMTDDGGPHAGAGPAAAVLFTGLGGTLAGWLPRLLADGLDTATRFDGWYAGRGAVAPHAAVSGLLSRRRALDVPADTGPSRLPGGDLPAGSPSRRPDGPPGTAREEEADQAGPPGGEAPPAARESRPPWPLPARPAAVHRFLPEELGRQAYLLRLEEARWHEVFPGDATPTVLDRLDRRPPGTLDTRALMAFARELSRARRLDAEKNSPYEMTYGTLDGLTSDGIAVRRSALMHCTNVSGLVGVLASVAVHEAAGGRLPSGTHPAAATLPPRGTADWIVRHLARATVRTTEIPTGATGTPTCSPMAARRPG
ncbi:saccharopine dehydrogenase NADP-binding domain-containing protein [Streptomyces sp. NBC_01216]|uniref:saccharopine dehydrogenase NADP-binding domain-containing protein n=1 Tax=Streptomyces sp. NBC_01216 TaxID=2903778 RepID=UPI002E0D4715|nr:saccharopine dehydrogenase NADP-binding domain-containing protein [Streptomyces sp. NBC_01216]